MLRSIYGGSPLSVRIHTSQRNMAWYNARSTAFGFSPLAKQVRRDNGSVSIQSTFNPPSNHIDPHDSSINILGEEIFDSYLPPYEEPRKAACATVVIETALGLPLPLGERPPSYLMSELLAGSIPDDASPAAPLQGLPLDGLSWSIGTPS